MRKKFIFLFLIFPFLSFGQECYDFESCVPENIKKACIEQTVNGCIDWTNGMIYTLGTGVPNDKFNSPAQRKYSALRAAEIVAQRNLLELISGVRLNAESTVETGILTSDRIKSRVSGTLKNFQRIGKPFYDVDNTATVIVRYSMRDLRTIASQNSSNRKTSSASKKEGGDSDNNQEINSNYNGFTGLILDARKLDVSPALSPKILNEEGEEIYGSAHVEREFSMKYGMIGYAKALDAAKQNNRVSGNPLILTPIGVSGKNNTDLILKDEDAKKISDLNKTQSFLREARVMMIVQ